jgi:hypothetical protein
LIPAGFDATIPEPAPLLLTVSVCVPWALVVNVAVTLRAWVMLTTQVPVPLHAPLQPVKVEPVLAAAVKVTEVPLAKFSVQSLPQVTPVGEEVTVPPPVPVFVTFRV